MDILKRLKELLEGKDRRKLVENAVILIIIGVIIIIAASTFFSGGGKTSGDKGDGGPKTDATEVLAQPPAQDRTDQELEAILSRIQGVGRVDVMITYVSGKENIPAYDTKKNESSTEEKDSGGGTRKISQGQYDSSVVYEDRQNGGKSPVILKEINPVVRGVVVVADGAESPEVKERIMSAVQVLMDIPAHKIQVLEMKK